MRIALVFWCSLALLGAAAYGFWRTRSDSSYGAAAWEDSQADGPADAIDNSSLEGLTLTERSGRPFNGSEMAGKVWVASYFFSTCPATCVRLNQALASLHHDEQFADLQLVSITCDPENDTPDVLCRYAERFDADPQRWLFCTGPFAQIQRIGMDVMKLAVDRKTHTDRAVVIDRHGTVRGRFVVTDENQFAKMKLVLAQCLAEAPPADKKPVQDATIEDAPPGESSPADEGTTST